MKHLILVSMVLFSSLAFAKADDVWCDVVGEKNVDDVVQYLRFSSRDCDGDDAKQNALKSCLQSGADYCGIPKCHVMQCRTKCNCD